MYQVPGEDNRVLEEIRRLREEVRSLQDRPLKIPTRQADPPAGDANNLWFLDDGRLRGKLRDGTIVEYSRTTHLHDDRYTKIGSPVTPTQGGGTSTAPPPAAAYQPTSSQVTLGMDWSRSFRLGGSTQRGEDGYLYYGYYSGTNAENMSMIHIAGAQAALAANAGGPQAIIEGVWLHLINEHTYQHSGTELRIGLHQWDTVPGSFQESEWPPFRVGVNKAGYGETDQWYQLPNWVGEKFRDGGIKGFTLHQGTTSQAYYGYARAFAELKIQMVK